MLKRIIVFFLLWNYIFTADAQVVGLFKEVLIETDTNTFKRSQHIVEWQDSDYFAFGYNDRDQTVTLRMQAFNPESIDWLKISPSADYQLIDSLRRWPDGYKVRLRFTDLSRANTLAITWIYKLKSAENEAFDELKLLPYNETYLSPQFREEDLYIGEEKVFELGCNRASNVRADNIWTSDKYFDYKIREHNNALYLHLVPKELGNKLLKIKIQTRRPFLTRNKQITYDLPLLEQRFTIKTGRLAFLSPDRKEVNMENPLGKGIEIQIDNHRNLLLRKTYRIEDQQESGGGFVGELYTRSMLSGDKVLCWIRPFALHKISDGYLYLKDGDEPRFITNLTISEKTQITKVSVMHEGGDWTDNSSVNPTETIDVRLEGKGMSTAYFQFGELEARRDSSFISDNMQIYRLKVPLALMQRKIGILHNKKPTGFELSVREYQKPHILDFVQLSYGTTPVPITELDKPVMYDKTIRDVVFSFRPERLDDDGKLFGKQYISIEINLYNVRKDLIETKKIENIVVCPDESSPRFAFYDIRDCRKEQINLNSYLAHKTYDLPDWTTIELIVKHNSNKYGQEGYVQRTSIILQKHYTFDVDVSFPAGLLVKRFDEGGVGRLSGISTAILAQFSFYKPDKIQKLKPFRIGVGALAINAFNFNNDVNIQRDVGLVVLGSIFPTRTGSKFSFPLYGGFGYLLNAERWFVVFGPGIQISF